MIVETHMRSPVVTIKADESVRRALFLMQTNRIRHLPVIENDSLIGIVSSRDVRSAIDTMSELDHKELFRLKENSIKEIMSGKVMVVHPETRIQDCARLMSEKKIGCAPVVKSGTMKLVGIITETDMLRIFARLLDKWDTEGKRNA